MLCGQCFQLHGGLAFVMHHVAQAEQAGGGVKPAAETGGRRAAQLAVEQGQQLFGIAGGVILLEPAADAIGEAGAVQCGDRHAPGFAGGTVAAGLGERAQMPQPGALGTLDAQQFAAPCRVIRPQADPVQRQADERRVYLLFGTQGGQMR